MQWHLNAPIQGQSEDSTALSRKDKLNILQVDFYAALKGMDTNGYL